MTHQQAYNEVTAYIEKAVQINLQHGEPELAYQKHLLLSFANSLKTKLGDYKLHLEVLISMIERSIEVNLEYKETKQADQLELIFALAKSLQDRAIDPPADNNQDVNLSLLN